MAKKFTLVDKTLVGIYLLDKIIDATLGASQRAYDYRKLPPFTPIGYKGSALHQHLYRLLKTGYLAKEIIGDEPVLTITRGGKDKLSRRFSYFKMRDKGWDGSWRLVIFDISEKQRFLRDKLRRKLKELGFGQWQKSIYISPFDLEEDMREFLEAEKLTGKAYVLTAKHKLLGDARKLADQVWSLSKLNLAYGDVLDKLNQVEVKPAEVYQQYLVILEKDPCLPKELLPDDWMGDKVRNKLANVFMIRSEQKNV